MINTKKLRRAIKVADIKQIQELLREDPKGKLRLYGGWNPLHIAIKGGNKDVVAVILEAGAQINTTSEKHQTPLDLALKFGFRGIVTYLIKKGAKRAAELSLHSAVAAADLKAVKTHLGAGADINAVINGELPLGIALEFRNWDIANYLLNCKCDVTKAQQWGRTPMHIAAEKRAPELILKKMAKLGAHMKAIDDCERTPLCSAAEAGDREMVDWLTEHGADVTFGRERESTPVYWALRNSHYELAAHLIDLGGRSTLHQAVQCNHLARARQKLNAGADANHEKDEHRFNSPLEVAIWNDSVEMVELLLEFGADPNLQGESFHGEHGMSGGDTALHEAVFKGSAKMVKLLLAHGADSDIANASGMTPVELANRKNHSHLAHLMEAHIDKQLSLAETQSPIEPLYTVPKVAELLSVDEPFVLDLIKTRKITGLKLDEKTVRITAGSIQRYLAKLAT